MPLLAAGVAFYAFLSLFPAMIAAVTVYGLVAGRVYRYAPDRDEPRFTWLSVGAAVAAPIWLVASFGFSVHVDNVGSYGETYGAVKADSLPNEQRTEKKRG